MQNALAKFAQYGPSAGYIGSEVDDTTGTLTIYWYGSLPEPAATLEAGVDTSKVNIKIIPAPFSAAQLNAEDEQISLNASKLGISFTGWQTDGNGFVIQFRNQTELKAAQSAMSTLAASRLAKNAVPSSLKPFEVLSPNVLGPAPITISSTLSDPQAFSTRQNDITPYFGGAIADDAYTECTTGFPMHRGTPADGSHEYLLIAGHCSDFADNYGVYTPQDHEIGTTSSVVNLHNNHYDAGLINVADFNAGNDNYDGAYNSSATKTVDGDAATSAKDLLCQSGAYSGTICGIKVVQYGTVEPFGDDYEYHVWKTMTTDGTSAGGKGDSGAPVFDISCGSSCMVAHGLLQGGDAVDNPAKCKGIATVCSSIMFFTDIQPIEKLLGIAAGNGRG